MTTSTWPHAWHFLDECDVPVEAQELPVSATLGKQNGGEALSVDSCSLSDSATLGVQNDSPDPTYQGCLPSERYPSDECDISCSPVISCDRKDDATGCDEDAKLTDSVSNAGPEHVKSCVSEWPPEHPSWVCNDCGQDRYGKPNGMSTWHYDYCRFCGEFVPCTDPRDFGDRHDSGQFPGQKTGSEEETHEDLQGKDADKMADTFDVPFSAQEWMFESLCEVEIENLHDLIDDHHDLIIEMARDRFRKGFCKYGSTMYSWSPERRLNETLQELADAVVYPTSGPIE